MIQKISSRQTFTDILNLLGLLNAVVPFFHMTLQFMMLYYYTKFACKWTASLEDIVKIVILDRISPRRDLDIEDSEAVILHNISSHENKPPYQVW